MKNGVTQTFKKMIVAVIYFMVFSILVIVTNICFEICYKDFSVQVFILLLLAMIVDMVFLILFLSAWQSIFEDEKDL